MVVMPICQVCKKREATVFLTQIINGNKTDLMMCRQCAGEGYKIDLNTLISGLLGLDWENEGAGSATEISCDRCGMTVDEFNRTGKMGCSHCYDVFREPMKVLLKRIQGNTRHQGKIPDRYAAAHAAEMEVERLQQELKECIRVENYERAAVIRDRIRQLEAERGGR
jgi:protein arginine kinase activator